MNLTNNAPVTVEQDNPCPPHCCCCGPGEPCCDCGAIMQPDWINAATCIENMQIAYDDATEDEDETPVDTVVSAGDLGVLIDLAKYAVAQRAALARPRTAEGEDFLTQLRRVNTERYQAWVGDRQDAGILFDAAELGGEVGELLNVVKKLEREDRGWRGSRAGPEDFADECADVLICLDKLARRRGVSLVKATVAKFNATSCKVGLPHQLSLRPAAAEPKLIESTADPDCGCPEEFWDAYGAHLHMHLNAGKPSNAHADFGDDGEAECEVTAPTIDVARVAFFAWVQSLRTTSAEPNGVHTPDNAQHDGASA